MHICCFIVVLEDGCGRGVNSNYLVRLIAHTYTHRMCHTQSLHTHKTFTHTHTPFTYEVAHHLCVCGVCDVGNCISRLLDQVAVSTFIEGRWPRKVPG